MTRPVTLFMIMPPSEFNDDVVEKATYLEHHLEQTFPGYEFQVIDLRTVQAVGPDKSVRFGSGLKFAAVPLMGRTSAGPDDPGYMCEMPSRTLLEDIVRECETFDFENTKRLVA